MKILVLVLSFDDNGELYSSLYKTQRQTWDSINNSDVEVFYYFGNSTHNFIKDKNIYVQARENYHFNLGEKFLQALELVKNHEFDYIFKTNSSSYVDKELLLDFIKDKPRANLYCGIIGNFHGMQYVSGCGTYISRDLVEYILNNKSKWNHALIEDVATADLLKIKDVKLYPGKRFDITEISFSPNQKIDPNHYHYRCKMQTNRNLDIENMYKIYNLKINRN